MSAIRQSLDVESVPLRTYPGETNGEGVDDRTTVSSPLLVLKPDERKNLGINDSPSPPDMPHEHPETPKPDVKQPISSVSPAPTHHQIILQNARTKITSSSTSIVFHGLVRCIISWFLIAGSCITLWLYKDRVISPGAKSVFDAVNIVLSIAFGLNIASSLKDIVLNIRWWILSRRRRPSEEVRMLCSLLRLVAANGLY